MSETSMPEEYWKTREGAAFNAIVELCNPDASLEERVEAANLLRAAIGMPTEHADDCAVHEVDEPDGSECTCPYWTEPPDGRVLKGAQ